jgi:hypothetical protein
MSLLSEAMESCVFMNKVKTLDGYGGYINEWTEGAEFDAAITFDTSIQARVGEKQGVTSRYTVTTQKALTLQYNDYFKRVRDGKYFHVTSDGDDRFTPNSATLDMRQVEAEEVNTLPR